MMSSRLFTFRLAATAAVLVCFCTIAGLRAAESPVTPPVTERVAPPAPAADLREALRQESDLEKMMIRRPQSLDSLFSRPRPAPVPPVSPQTPPARRKEQPGDWMFLTPEDVIRDYVFNEILKLPDYGPDGRDRNSMSAVERHFERASRRGATNAVSLFDSLGLQKLFGGPNDNENTERPNRVAEFDLNRPQPNDPSNPPWSAAIRPPTLAEFLGLSARRNDRRSDPTSPEAIRERKAREEHLENFRKVWSVQPPPSPVPTGNQLAGAQSRSLLPNAWDASQAIGDAGNPLQPLPNVRPTSTMSLPAPAVLRNNPAAPAQDDFYSQLPPLTPRRKPMPSAEFIIPQRRF